jgi:acetyltransferase-like isoleucine patch superfamily enzyme
VDDPPKRDRKEDWRDQWKFGAPGHYQFRRIHEAIRTENKTRWRRSLPFPDELFDRWERAKFLGFGENSSVYDSAVILGEVSVGREVWIGPGVILDGTGGLSIGDHSTVSSGVQIYSHSSLQRCLTAGRAPVESRPTSIGRATFIGSMSIVNLGVALGDHVVVAAHSMVGRSFPDFAIVGGCPARKIGEVELVDDGARAVLHFEKSPGGPAAGAE